MIIIRNTIIKILDNEIWVYKNKELDKIKSNELMKYNYITNYKNLSNVLKDIIKKYKLTNTVFQNKIYILINKLYCETNIFIIKNVLYNLGLNNYKFIYEEDYYINLNESILSIWNTIGIFIKDNKEYYIDLINKINIDKIKDTKLLITLNKEIIKDILDINKDIVIYENTKDSIFSMIDL